MIKPAMANPFGCLKRPINENNIPKNQTTKLTPGTQENSNEISASTKPAVPSPLLCACGVAWT